MIELNSEKCPIQFGNDDVLIELDKFIGVNYIGESVFILCDSNTLEFCLPKLDWLELDNLKDAEVLEVEPGETSKSIDVYFQLTETLLALGANRKSLLVNLGGGVVSDLGGFVASTFKRGIDFINVPTTLLSMVDASIGGKTGINAGGAKNQLGTFSEPRAIFISDVFLETLSKLEWNSGLGEMIKHLLISDRDAISKLDKLVEELSIDNIFHSASVKMDIVQSDYKESGERKKLNYGHTFGHAIESFLHSKNQPITHGEAVIMGMLLENNLATKLGLLSQEENGAIALWLSSNFSINKYIKHMEVEPLLELMKFDKKNESDSMSFSLIGPIGKCNIDVIPEVIEVENILIAFCV